jgi:sugar phosphate isomerase/epimerase
MKTMKLGFVSAILPELNLEQVLVFAAQERFACVEVMCWPVGKAERKYAGVTHIDVAGFTRARAEGVHALCSQHRIELSALGYYPNLLDPDLTVAKAVRVQLEHVIKAASLLGLKTVNTFVGARLDEERG